MRISSHQVDDLLEVVLEKTGMDLSGYRRSMLSHRLSWRLARLDMSADEYLQICRDDAEECSALVNSIAINVSWFFRNPIVFETIAGSILPRLLDQKRAEFRVWSAGCAAGEEAYSIALLIREELRRIKNTDCQCEIFATDTDRDVLEKARLAYYPRERLKDTKLWLVDAGFSPEEDGFRLCPEVRRMVHFSFCDLLSDQTAAPVESVYSSFDIVLCRNVLIYFSDEHQKQVLQKLHNSLARGGYLVLEIPKCFIGM